MLLVPRYVSCLILSELSPEISLGSRNVRNTYLTLFGPLSWVVRQLTSVAAPGLLTSVAIFEPSADFGRTGWAIVHVNGLLVTLLTYLF